MRNGDHISRANAEFNAGPADLVITLRDFDVGERRVNNLRRDRRGVAPRYLNSRQLKRKGSKHFAESASARRPELVVVAVNYPIGSRNRRPPGHSGDPTSLAEGVIRPQNPP